MVLVVLGMVDEDRAVALIDFETILLLLGMMPIVAMRRRSGVFSACSCSPTRCPMIGTCGT